MSSKPGLKDMDQTIATLARLEQLPENWDGYGSPPVRKAALTTANKLIEALEKVPLPTPSIAPVTGGGIGFAWQSGSRELEIEILPDGSATYLAAYTNSDTEEVGALSLDRVQPAQGLAAWLLGD